MDGKVKLQTDKHALLSSLIWIFRRSLNYADQFAEQ